MDTRRTPKEGTGDAAPVIQITPKGSHERERLLLPRGKIVFAKAHASGVPQK